MTTGAGTGPRAFLFAPAGFQPVRPNTPVLPYGAPLSTATFLDPSAHILNGFHVVIGQKTYVGPFATLNASSGFIKIGSNSAVLDNASIIPNPTPTRQPASVVIGDSVQIGFGAVVLNGSTIGAFDAASAPTGIGPNALIDGAKIQPGAVVGGLARVGPGVTVPAGVYVLPGANVTTDAEASDPALGKVVALPASILDDLKTSLTRDSQLAAGYTNLFQGNSATGASPGVAAGVQNIFNGNLAAVLGTSQQPGPSNTAAVTGINFEPKKVGPSFPGPHKPQVEGLLPNFRARVTGDARFAARAHQVNAQIGRSNAIRADQGQPFRFASAPRTGRAVTINAPLGGSVTSGGKQSTIASSPAGVTFVTLTGTKTETFGAISFGENFSAASGAVILGGPATSYKVGKNVSVGGYAVVDRSNLGDGVVVGPRAFVSRSTVAAGQVVPPGTILIDNKVVGQIQW
ncbi:MAG: carbonic anhydrase/acetyltransferase [Isosphaeraceae bacterium]